jgi:hypothetical protein
MYAKLTVLFFATFLSFLSFSTLGDESLSNKDIFESKSLSIFYSKYPNNNYSNEYGTYKYFWVSFQARGKYSDPECVYREAQIISEMNFSFKDLNRTFTFTKDCPNIAITGDTGFQLQKFFSDEELEEIKKQPQLLKLSVLNSKVTPRNSKK